MFSNSESPSWPPNCFYFFCCFIINGVPCQHHSLFNITFSNWFPYWSCHLTDAVYLTVYPKKAGKYYPWYSDSLRENSVQAVIKLLPQLKTDNPDEIYRIVIDKVFYAIDKESTEDNLIFNRTCPLKSSFN